MLRLTSTVIFLFIAFMPKLALATFNDISGSYSGTINFTDADQSPGSCTTAGNGTGTLTITLNGDDQGAISGGTGQFVNNLANTTDSISSIAGTNNDTSFFVSFSTTTGSGDLAGTFTSNAITVSSGNVNGATCMTTITGGVLNRTDTNVINTSETSSSTVTEAALFNTQAGGAARGITNRTNTALVNIQRGSKKTGGSVKPVVTDNQFQLQGMTGLNAGENTIPYGIWGNYSYTDYENDLSTTAFDGTSHNFLGGIDFNLWDNAIIGVALGYERGNIDTTFNNGEQETDSFTIAPYYGLILDDLLSLDFSLGYARVSYDQFRTAGTTRVTSSPNADRWFGAFNLNAIKFIDNWVIGGRIGTLFARSSIDQFTESNGTIVAKSSNKIGSMNIAADVAYTYNEFEPFISLVYNYDFSLQQISTTANPQPTNDPNDLLFTTGVRFFGESGVTGNLEYSKRFLRDNFDEDRISLTIRADY